MAEQKPREHKVFNFELKDVDLDSSVFTGYSAAMGNRDLGNDIIAPGAFQRTIKERVSRRYIKFLDNHNSYSTRDVWGTVVEAEEVPFKGTGDNAPTHKLLTTFEVSRSDANAQVALQKIAERHLDQLSIGFRSLKDEYAADEDSTEDDPRWAWIMGQGTRTIKEVQWWETSVVIWAMNPEAQILANSVTSLLDFAQKAAAGGVKIPDDTVRQTIQALQLLTGEACPEDGPTEDVRKALAGIKSTVDRLDGDLEERLRVLLADYAEMHGEPDVETFSVWVSGTLTGGTPDTEDDTVADDEKTDDVDDETKEVETPPETDGDEKAEEVPEDPEPSEETATSTAIDEVRSLLERAEQLAKTLVTGNADDDVPSSEDAVDDTADHDEEEEAAKGAEVEDDTGRTEHFPDGTALALAALELDLIDPAA